LVLIFLAPPAKPAGHLPAMTSFWDEGVARSFSLAESYGIAVGFFTHVLLSTGRRVIALASTAALVTMPLFATFSTCAKFENDGMLLSVWPFATFLRAGQTKTRAALAGLGLLCVLAFLAHWTAALFAGLLGVAMLVRWLRRDDANARRSATS
jgi:4-amino-4-deoxy-L-arabinose transferase-like glycosyltransferase